MTVNSDPATGPTKGLAISGPLESGDGGGTARMIVRDHASFRVEQDLALGTGAADTSEGTLEVVGPDAEVSVGGNLSMAVDLDGNATPGTATLSVVITCGRHAAVNVAGEARIGNGHLKVKLDGYKPASGQTYPILQAASFDGQFLETDFTEAPLAAGLSWELKYKPDAVLLKVTGPPPLAVGSVARNASNLTLHWSGGTPPYQLQMCSNLTKASWFNLGSPGITTSATVPISGNKGYFRIQGQ